MESEGTTRKGFRLTGRVQGVGFRWWTRRTAEDLGLRGTVRNCRDGSVEIHAEGEQGAMDTFSRRLRSGPSSARVDGVEEVEASASLPEGFRIVH